MGNLDPNPERRHPRELRGNARLGTQETQVEGTKIIKFQKVPFLPLLGHVSNAPQLLRPYSQVDHFQSRRGGASPVHLRCRTLSPGLASSRSDKKDTAKSRVCHPLDFSFETLFHGLTERGNPDGPYPFLNHSRD